MNPKVDFYFEKDNKWQESITLLRDVVLGCDLAEELKWGCPCYALQKRNIVLIHVFKDYCALLFFKGALMPDPQNILIQQTENVQAARQIRFTSLAEVKKLKTTLKAYIQEAIEVEKSGEKVPVKKTKEYAVPDEFRTKLDNDKNLKTAFESLTPGRQRAYLLYFSAAKQAKTRESRVENAIPRILDGKGLDD